MVIRTKIVSLGIWGAVICVGILSQMTQKAIAQTCDAATDSKILARILYEIGSSPLGPQLRHINIYPKMCIVELRGYTNQASDRDQVMQIVEKTRDVVAIKVLFFYPVPPPLGDPTYPDPDNPSRCLNGYVQCNDICVPAAQCPISRKPPKKQHRRGSKVRHR